MDSAVTTGRGSRLPAEVSGFVGREAELARISTLLAAFRLVTVTGPGGVGKTRVTVRAAARAAADHPDGVCLVELSGLRDPALLPATVAGRLGLPEQDVRTQLDAVLDYLRDRRLLLILDTCEHLIDACAAFADAVLREAPGVTLLASSRQSLDAPGEVTYQLPPLTVPALGEAGAGTGDAVELFEQRAALAAGGFAVTAANRDAVIRLCRRLDGMPLAIELAAVRLRALSLDELIARLDDRFDVLTGERRGGLPRHRTLHTAIGWSYDLCSDAERALWRRLSVFAGSFDERAVAEVCADPGLPATDTLTALTGLVDKSVILTDGGRYRLLDTLREFGAMRLAEAGEEAAFRDRHLARYRSLARCLDDHFEDDDQLERLDELRRDHANVQAALSYALPDQPGRGDPERARERDGADLAASLWGYWQVAAPREGSYWLGKVTDRFPEPSVERARALAYRGYVTAMRGEAGAADEAAESFGIAVAIGDELTAARALSYLHLAQTLAGKFADAEVTSVESVRRLEAVDDNIGLVCLDAQLGHRAQLSGDPEACLRYTDRGLARLGPGSKERWATSTLLMIAGLALFQLPGNDAECAAKVTQALRYKHELQDVIGTAYQLDILGWLAARRGRYEWTAGLLGAAEPLWERAGQRLGSTAVLEECHQRAERDARAALGDPRYDALHAAGERADLDRLVNHVLSGADGVLSPQP